MTTTMPEPARRARTGLPILVLVLITPLLAELAWGSTPLQYLYAFPIFVLMYGTGTLLVRELVRRTGRGWPSILLLGLAYGIIEEGVVLQSFFSPQIYEAPDWGARFFGVNLVYAITISIYHMIFSVALPIQLTELFFPATRHVPYLRTRGLILTIAGFVLGLAAVRFTVPPSIDPGFNASPTALAGCAIVIAGLALLALRILPPRADSTVPGARTPAPFSVAMIAAALTIPAIFLPATAMGILLDPIRSTSDVVFVATALVVPTATVIVALALIRRWTRSRDWSDLHRTALVTGAFVAHTLVGMTYFVKGDPVALVFLSICAVAELTLGIVLYRVVARRATIPEDARHVKA
ncbi:hypothetical protein [Agromyces laixinhei]|uniref:hypothetical protein n=1 Tax=Agromyces laixinhei TaxID=2585717 RepID=UPI0012EDB237|nr:hypothetical protein [Agromyces laixinhei]